MITKFWVGVVKNRCGQSGHRNLKLTVSQDWIERINWFFACRSKLQKAKSYFNYFWVAVVKYLRPFSSWDPNICCILKWVYELRLIFTCWLWWNNNNFWLDQHFTLSISFTFKCHSAAVVLVGPTTVAGRVLWNRVSPSFHPAICPSVFLELDSSIDIKRLKKYSWHKM